MKVSPVARLTGLLVAGIFMLGAAVAAEDAVAQPMAFSIESQAIGDALNEFASQSGYQVLFLSKLGRDVQAPAVQGTLSPQQALEKLLAGSGLRYELINPRTVTIRAEKETDAAELAQKREGLRVAQSQASKSDEQNPAAQGVDTEQGGSGPEAVVLDEVVVTGTHIRGSQPAGSKVLVLDREYIDKTGYGRIEDVLATLPQTFGGNTEGNQPQDAQNLNRGSEIQLRGLGIGTTLVLVNGRRQAAGGLQGAFVDVSSIPVAAIDRIEVLADGASAIYGSDAIGGVVDIKLRKNYQGAESRVRLATAAGGFGDEIQLAQLLGGNWSSGNGFIGYQYFDRDEIPGYARAATASNGDFTSRGGGDFRQFAANPATIVDPVTLAPLFAIPEGQDGTNLSFDDLVPGANFTDFAHTFWAFPKQRTHSVFAAASQRLTDSIELTADAHFSKRKFTTLSGGTTSFLFVDTSNPFYFDAYGDGTPFVVFDYDFTDDLGPARQEGTTDTYAAAVGLTGELPNAWRANLSASYGRERNRWVKFNDVNFDALFAALFDTNRDTAFNPFGDGSHTNPATLEAIRLSLASEGRSTVKSLDLIFDGPLLQLPGGAARLAVGAGYRDEKLNTISESGLPDEIGRHSSAAFAELALPLVSENSQRPGLNRLELSLAGRYEDYNDFGSTFDPKYGLSWWPLPSLKVRGTWGTSFRAPPFSLLSPVLTRQVSAFQPVTDQSGGTVNVLALAGGNSELKQETATVWSAGLDFVPPSLPDLNVSLTYFDIDYRDKIGSPSSLEEVVANQDRYAAIITSAPTAEEIAAICSRPDFLSSPTSCDLPIALIIDARNNNIAVTQVTGVDFDLRYALDSALGKWAFGLGGTRTFHNRFAITTAAPSADTIDTALSPLSLRWRGNVSWSRAGWSADAFVNHQGSYDDTLSPTPRQVDAYTTTDINVAYAIPEGHGWLGNTQISLSATNVFNQMPPLVNWFYGYDLANARILGRLTSIQIVKGW